MWSRKEYYDMVMLPVQNKMYWLSTRSVNMQDASSLMFNLQYVFTTGITLWPTYVYRSGTNTLAEKDIGIRPLILIPLNCCKITISQEPNMDFDISIK